MIELKDGLVEEYGETPEPSVIIKDQRVLILMEVVQTPLRDAIFDLDCALYILLF